MDSGFSSSSVSFHRVNDLISTSLIHSTLNMGLRFILFSSVVMFMAWQLEQVHGMAIPKDRNADRTRLKAALKVITVDLPAWDKLPTTPQGISAKATQLSPIVSAVASVGQIEVTNFRADKKSPTDAKIIEKTKVGDLVKKFSGVKKGLDALQKAVTGNPQHIVNAAAAIKSFNQEFKTGITALQTEYNDPGVQKLLDLKD